MKTHTQSQTGLAVLNSTQPTQSVGFAALSLESGADGWFHLLPAGEFKAIDGRPFDVESGHWMLDEATAQDLIADLKSRVNPTVIDYEHQTLLADKNGLPAPASGWIKDAQWRESGLWVKADWTERAQGYIKGGEYAYLSAVFPYDKATGKPLSLHSAALVNRPGCDGLSPVALRALDLSLSPDPQPDLQPEQESAMELSELIALLGLNESATKEQVLEALKKLQKDKADGDAEVAALKANPPSADVDLSQYVPLTVVTEMQSQMAALSAQVQTGGLDQLISDAKKEGRLLPAMEGWARDLGKKDIAALKSYLDKSQPVAALSAMQAGDETPPPKDGAHGLSHDELEAAKLTGRTPEEYAALKAL
ncbi:phage protease [Oceanospirillum sp.]|uniref:phage protease n=1 Tax=Oceanospirillum sp. TaxID=2021254 RepID=UPI003A929EA9